MPFTRVLSNLCSDRLSDSRGFYAIHARAERLGLTTVQAPRNAFYGQRRIVTVDPNGCLVDVCSPWSGYEQ